MWTGVPWELNDAGEFSPYALRLIRFGALAPSRHNTQPWKFSIHKNAIQVHPDFTRRLPVIDPEDRSVHLSLGCVTENIVIAARYYGFSTELEHFGSRDNGSVLIRFTAARYEPSTAELISGMTLRQCIRHSFTRAGISRRDLSMLAGASRQPGVEFGLLTDAKDIERVAEVVRTGRGDHVRTASLAVELASWTRFSRREAESEHDGLLFTEMGYPPMPKCVGRRIVAALVRANLQKERSAAFIRNSSALMYFAPQRDDGMHWFNVGRSFQRVVLTAAAGRIRYAHLQLPYSSPANSEDLGHCLGCGAGRALLVARLGYSRVVPRSLRRPFCRMLTAYSNERSPDREERDGVTPCLKPIPLAQLPLPAELHDRLGSSNEQL